ncbi:glycine cleavage system H protein, mitochondrial-like [Cydia splendana]|uniref:glycine cleavage system H protein, mitochondrial-like n=1 Tax=Cydia splendana TaxID=1100963 RepID=UPI00300D2E1C
MALTIIRGKLFTKKHEWISITNNIGTIGISNYAQEALGEVVYCQLPEVGTELVAGQECAALESVKAASEVYAPVSGTVTEKNKEVESSPGLINKSCYGEGWLFRVRLSQTSNFDNLMTHAAYEDLLRNHEEH